MFLVEDIIPEMIGIHPFQFLYELWDDFYKGNIWETEFDDQWLAVNGDGLSIFILKMFHHRWNIIIDYNKFQLHDYHNGT